MHRRVVGGQTCRRSESPLHPGSAPRRCRRQRQNGGQQRHDTSRAVHFVRRLAASRMRLARAGLKTPQEQKRVSVAAACSGVRRLSLTKSIIFFASEC